MIRELGVTAFAAAMLAAPAPAQSRTLQQGAHRMEITLERLEKGSWHVIDPGLVLAQGDRVRFRFHTNFDGFLYVTNFSSSGKYGQLFPREETGQNNQIASGQAYQVPETATVFRIAGPPGYETVYWLVSPTRLSAPPATPTVKPLTLSPRCDDSILKARGDCVDSSAGPKLIPREVELPQDLAQAAGDSRRELLFMRQENKAVISSPEPLTGPVVYEFRLAHR
jgi:hypothetical protein